MTTISDDRMIMFLAMAFFLGALWGIWYGKGESGLDALQRNLCPRCGCTFHGCRCGEADAHN